jgi:hypothetical protein
LSEKTIKWKLLLPQLLSYRGGRKVRVIVFQKGHILKTHIFQNVQTLFEQLISGGNQKMSKQKQSL